MWILLAKVSLKIVKGYQQPIPQNFRIVINVDFLLWEIQLLNYFYHRIHCIWTKFVPANFFNYCHTRSRLTSCFCCLDQFTVDYLWFCYFRSTALFMLVLWERLYQTISWTWSFVTIPAVLEIVCKIPTFTLRSWGAMRHFKEAVVVRSQDLTRDFWGNQGFVHLYNFFLFNRTFTKIKSPFLQGETRVFCIFIF